MSNHFYANRHSKVHLEGDNYQLEFLYEAPDGSVQSALVVMTRHNAWAFSNRLSKEILTEPEPAGIESLVPGHLVPAEVRGS